MRILTRDTATGKEYWDTKEKRSIFVPVGKLSDFEVTAEPVSMIGGVDLASGKDMTVLNPNKLLGLTAEQIITIAKEHGIEVPGNMKKVETIHKYIVEQLAADDE